MEADADPGYGSALVVITVMQLKTFWSTGTSSWRERVDSLRSDREMSASKLTTRSEIVIIDHQ